MTFKNAVEFHALWNVDHAYKCVRILLSATGNFVDNAVTLLINCLRMNSNCKTSAFQLQIIS